MCGPTDIIDTNGDISVFEIIEQLSSKSQEFESYTAQDMIDLCTEMLENFRNRADEWSDIGSWRIKELQVQKLYEKGSINETCKTSMAASRQVLSQVMWNYLDTCIRSYEMETEAGKKASKKIELLEKVKKVTMEDGKCFNIYGPIPTSFPNHTVELHTLPITKDDTSRAAEESEEKKSEPGSVAVILGAGNQPQLSLFDALQCCLVRREVLLLKHHPLRPHLIEPYSILLEPLIRRGFLHQVQDAGIPETNKILSHPAVNHVHITGSLVADRAVREVLSMSKPHLSKIEIENMVTSELGASTPIILADGHYTEKELIHAARSIVFHKKINGGCNCLDAQVVVIPKTWKQKTQFRKELTNELKRQPNNPTYYPGSRERAREMAGVYSALGSDRAVIIECDKTTGIANDPQDNVTVVECGTPGEDGYEGCALKREAFGPILALVELPNGDVNHSDYLNDVVVPFLNNKENIYGSLSCVVLAPASAAMEQVNRAAEALEYGTVAINSSNVMGWAGSLLGCVWCAHPLAPGRESGAGVNGNHFKLPNPAKTVVRGPPLATAPLLDGAKPPPSIIIDALYTMNCASSTFIGLLHIGFLLFKNMPIVNLYMK